MYLCSQGCGLNSSDCILPIGQFDLLCASKIQDNLWNDVEIPDFPDINNKIRNV